MNIFFTCFNSSENAVFQYAPLFINRGETNKSSLQIDTKVAAFSYTYIDFHYFSSRTKTESKVLLSHRVQLVRFLSYQKTKKLFYIDSGFFFLLSTVNDRILHLRHRRDWINVNTTLEFHTQRPLLRWVSAKVSIKFKAKRHLELKTKRKVNLSSILNGFNEKNFQLSRSGIFQCA